jgi:tRNA (guanine-N7-)-methyltransferase
MLSADPTPIASDAEIVPANNFAPLDLAAIYGRKAPIEVDLGCGDGSFLAAIAGEKPARDFLGIERLLGRTHSACRKIESRGLSNARILRFDISSAVGHLLPVGSVVAFHLMFPDPWPKRRHASRRLVTDNFLASIHRALIPNGTLAIATDDANYFRQVVDLVTRSPQFAAIADPVPTTAVSKFEKTFKEAGTEIHRLVLRKVSDVI